MPQATTFAYNTSWEKVRRVFPAKDGLTVLDLGCGDGRIVQHLTVTNDVHGLDASADAVTRANAVGLHAIQGNVEDSLPYPDARFDVVLALDILEHVVNVEDVLDEVRRVLRPNGSLIISLPNHFDLRTRIETLFGHGIIRWSQRAHETQPWTYAHVRFLRLQDVRAMLAATGWYPDLWQINFMSQGLLPTRFIPPVIRRFLVRHWPNAWSGKFVVRCGKTPATHVRTEILDHTPTDF